MQPSIVDIWFETEWPTSNVKSVADDHRGVSSLAGWWRIFMRRDRPTDIQTGEKKRGGFISDVPATQKGGENCFCAFFRAVENHHFCIIITKAWQWWWSHSFQPFLANKIFSSRMHSLAINKTIERWQPRFSLFLFLQQSRRLFVSSPQNSIRVLAGCQLQATGNCKGSPILPSRA